jgi:ribosome-associated protein
LRLNKTQKAAVAALEDIKARDITVLDTRPLTAIYDSLIVATAESARQTKALARHVSDKVKEAGGQVLSIEGEESGEWVLVDCTDLVVHIMLPTTRALYNLEELWTPPAPVRAPKAEKAAKPQKPSAASKKPATKPAAKKPVAKPAAKKPAAKKPAIKKPAVKKPAAKAPAVKKVATKKPAAKSAASKKPAAKKPATKRNAA